LLEWAMHLTPLEASPGLVGEPPCRKPAGSAPKPSKQAESPRADVDLGSAPH